MAAALRNNCTHFMNVLGSAPLAKAHNGPTVAHTLRQKHQSSQEMVCLVTWWDAIKPFKQVPKQKKRQHATAKKVLNSSSSILIACSLSLSHLQISSSQPSLARGRYTSDGSEWWRFLLSPSIIVDNCFDEEDLKTMFWQQTFLFLH